MRRFRPEQVIDVAWAVGSVTRQSPAKINWNLRVVHRRPDGFHEIESLISPVTLYDELTLRVRTELGIELVCDRADVPLDERNLIVKAANAMAERASLQMGVKCGLVKRIPIGGGLGGGSSNAAIALMGLSELWDLNWPATVLQEIAAQIGSDVPFFLSRGSAIIRGRGERVECVVVDFRGWIVLLLPAFAVSTAAVYARYTPDLRGTLPVEPVTGLDASGWMQRAFNELEPAAFKVCPALEVVLEHAAALAGRPVRMSGSGSSLFTAFDTAIEAMRFAHDAARQLSLETRVVQVSV